MPLPTPLFPLLFLLFSTASSTSGVPLWCVAKNNADDASLQAALDWTCGPSGGAVDCSAVASGGACFEPQDLQFHASCAFNEYYRRRSGEPNACDFAGNALLTQLDPTRSIAGVDPQCKFISSLGESNGSFVGSATVDPLGYDNIRSNGLGRHVTSYWAVFWALMVGLLAAITMP